ncbi:hypothetical protein DFJ73DRAFT_797709 [Zopfochytrium polystomum]|nr:hypothetical protein DFJ73DRAFT_797709 [Zopfochytrium polystomum]
MPPKPYPPPHPATMHHRPQTPTDVDAAVRGMDAAYGTSFAGWIRDPANIGYLATFKKPLFRHYLAHDPRALAVVLQWLTAEWSVADAAHLLLKMFYTSHMDSPTTSSSWPHLSGAVSAPWPRARRRALASALLAGEPASRAAAFVRGFAAGIASVVGASAASAAAEVAAAAARDAGWDGVFMAQFLRRYAALGMRRPAAAAAAWVARRAAALAALEDTAAAAAAVADDDEDDDEADWANDDGRGLDGAPARRRRRQRAVAAFAGLVAEVDALRGFGEAVEEEEGGGRRAGDDGDDDGDDEVKEEDGEEVAVVVGADEKGQQGQEQQEEATSPSASSSVCSSASASSARARAKERGRQDRWDSKMDLVEE